MYCFRLFQASSIINMRIADTGFFIFIAHTLLLNSVSVSVSVYLIGKAKLHTTDIKSHK